MRLTKLQLEKRVAEGKKLRAAFHPTVSQIALNLMKEQARVRAELWTYAEIAGLTGVKVSLVEQIMATMIHEYRMGVSRNHRGFEEENGERKRA